MTIKERADRAIYKPTDRHPLKLYEAIAFARGYELGATEQKAIDEEVRLKKCDDMTEAEYEREVAFAEWYHQNGKGTPTFSDAIEWARRELIDNACFCQHIPCAKPFTSIEGFRKVMQR